MSTTIYHRVIAGSRSIRWRLPLTYAGIALLTVIALTGVLLFTLRSYYHQREQEYLETYAPSLAGQAEQMLRDDLSDDEMQSAVDLLSFLVRARVQLLDPEMQLVADSGPVDEQEMINVDFFRREVDPPPGPVPIGVAGNTGSGPYLSIIRRAGSLVVGGAPDEEVRSPMPVRRGPFGQILTDQAETGQHSDQRVTVAFYSWDGSLKGYLNLSEGPAFGSAIVEDVAKKGIVAGLVAVVIAAAAGVVVSRSINRPVLALVAATRQMAQGDLATRVRLDRRDEFGLLAGTFNSMAERVEATVTTLKRFVEDAAHEINTPLTALHTNLELTTLYDMSSAARSDIEKALAELMRLERLTRSLLTLARLEAPGMPVVRTSVDLSALLRQMVERCASRAEQAEITVESAVPLGPICIQADHTQIARLFDNLLDNALKFTPAGGSVSVGMQTESDDRVRVWVQDTGIGIAEAELPRLFSRFHRGRNAAAYPGNGLGLVIAKSIVEEHGGQIVVESSSGVTRFTVTLPCDPKGPKL